ncbi:MAG: acetylornithine deacetylase [Bdellovibrionales bacterium]
MNITFLLDKLISFPSVSGKSNKDIIDWVSTFLRECGAEVDIISGEEGKSCLFARIGGQGCNESAVLFSGHLDVVPADPTDWTSNPFVVREEDNKIYGRGSCDMKGFLACALLLFEELKGKQITKPIHLAMTYDEETNMEGAKLLADWLKARNYRTDLVWLGEPTMLEVVVAHKGVCDVVTKIKGVSTHSSSPQSGVNAVYLAADFVNWIQQTQEEISAAPIKDSLFNPPYTTLNVGKISGGTSSNVVPDESAVVWEYRLHPSDDEDIFWQKYNAYWQKTLSTYQGTFPSVSVSQKKHLQIPPFQTDPSFQGISRLCQLVGKTHPQVASYGTEAPFFQQIGLPTLICGPGNIAQAHKVDEYVEIDQLNKCLEFMRAFACGR